MLFVIGHRGASGYEPENTIISFKKALDLKVDGIELDVHTCKSGEIVVIHDDKVDRTTNGTGYVKNLTLDQLKSLDAGKGQEIPTLEEVLDVIDKKAHIVIELKERGTLKQVFETIDRYVQEKNWSYNNFTIVSFDCKLLEEYRKLDPKVNIGILFLEAKDNFLETAKNLDAKLVGLHYKSVTKELVGRIHKNDIFVVVYPVNDLHDIKKMCSLGVDGIVTNYPDRVPHSL